jgi:cbb3-type cytochrome oxidase subunit 1
MFIVQSLFLVLLWCLSIITPIIGIILNINSGKDWFERPTILNVIALLSWMLTPFYTFAFIVSFLPDFLLKMGYLVKP